MSGGTPGTRAATAAAVGSQSPRGVCLLSCCVGQVFFPPIFFRAFYSTFGVLNIFCFCRCARARVRCYAGTASVRACRCSSASPHASPSWRRRSPCARSPPPVRERETQIILTYFEYFWGVEDFNSAGLVICEGLFSTCRKFFFTSLGGVTV